MALNKVYLCGVNTSKLPVLSEEEKKDCLIGLKREMPGRDSSS